MQLEKIPLPDTHSFSPFFLDYITGSGRLTPFYNHFPSVESFAAQIREKSSFPPSSRKILTDTLTRQYDKLTVTTAVKDNLLALASSKTFTITTGHQLNIFTGPLYFIYKIITVINICKQLRQQYPDNNFVPVYWMASEDHDFEEISYFRLYGKKYQWSTKQTGAVGRFNPSELSSILDQLPGDVSVFRDAYLGQKTLADAGRAYVNSIFGDQGVIVVDADDRDLKSILQPVMEADIFKHSIKDLVATQSDKLTALGYHTQVNARDINFFYLDNNLRERLEADGSGFKVINTETHLTKEQVEETILKKPEAFSPNVILRPLYQEMILPNLAYIGGPSEVVYWLQLQSVFETFRVPFPILMPRNFAMVVDHTAARKFQKTGLELKDLFETKNYLFNHWTLRNTTNDLTLTTAIESVNETFARIKEQAEKIDSTLAPLVAAKNKQSINSLQKIESKMLRAEKRKHAEKLAQIDAIKDLLFPAGNLQERTDNFLNFYQQKPEFINHLIDSLDPFDYRMHVLMYDN